MAEFTVLMVDDDGDYSEWIRSLEKTSPGLTFLERPAHEELARVEGRNAREGSVGQIRVLTAQSAKLARNVLLRFGGEIQAVFVDMTFTGINTLSETLADDDLECQLVSLEAGSLNLDGFRLAHLAREMNPRVYIAVITGQTPSEMMEQPHVAAMYGDIDAWISKRDIAAALYFSFKQALRNGHSSRLPTEEYDIIGECPTLRAQLDNIPLYSKPGVSLPVLIRGETGTGKEGVAKAVHKSSQRAERPFVPVNCTALVETLAESELFGHEKGSFTGAIERRQGAFELAIGGTIFLDEIGDMPISVQAKLLRTLEVGSIQRVGSMSPIPVDVRIVAATNANLEELVARRQFRLDLYHRINVLPLCLPPLRTRGGDVHLLAAHFLSRIRTVVPSVKATTFASAVSGRFESYSWPGNVRELKNMVERAAILSGGATQLKLIHFPEELRNAQARKHLGQRSVESYTDEELQQALDQAGGNRTSLARLLGHDRKKVSSLLKARGLGNGQRGRPKRRR